MSAGDGVSPVADARVQPHGGSVAGVADCVRGIDSVLFRPGSWRALDAGNRVVAGVRPGSLDAAVGLCGQGSVATFFGRLRSGVVVVDVDLADSREAVAGVVGWCVEAGLWHLVRASGRPGHQHVFVVAGEQLPALQEFTSRLRAGLRVGRSAIDVRDTVRPLCAPHRSGAPTPMPRRLRGLARALPRALQSLPPTLADSPPHRTPTAATVVVHPAVPRPVRALPLAWARYLSDGVVPPQVAGWADRSRSAVEATATYQMACAGWTAQRAWTAVCTAHPKAMAKARERGEVWWTQFVWNRAAADAIRAPQFPVPDPVVAGSSEPGLGGQVAALRGAFLSVWTNYGPHRRHTLRIVLEVLCERMLRTGTPMVPCPERDLVIDTGITSRKTLRAALHQLHDDGWLVLHQSHDRALGDDAHRSHHVALPARPPHPVPETVAGGLAHSYPPRSFTPLRPHLPTPLWHTLLSLHPTTPRRPDDLLDAAGAGSPRSALSWLGQLAVLGLADCDASGGWVRSNPPAQLLELAKQSHIRRCTQVGAERADYELVRAGRGRWEQQRQAAIERGRLARYRGSQQWWLSLSEVERTERSTSWGNRYARLPVVEQAVVKDRLARARADGGVVSEEAIRQAWLAGMTDGQYTERVVSRSAAFHAKPPPVQAALVGMWVAHRQRWGVQRQGSSRIGRAELIDRQERLALGSALDRDPHGRLAGTGLRVHPHQAPEIRRRA